MHTSLHTAHDMSYLIHDAIVQVPVSLDSRGACSSSLHTAHETTVCRLPRGEHNFLFSPEWRVHVPLSPLVQCSCSSGTLYSRKVADYLLTNGRTVIWFILTLPRRPYLQQIAGTTWKRWSQAQIMMPSPCRGCPLTGDSSTHTIPCHHSPS